MPRASLCSTSSPTSAATSRRPNRRPPEGLASAKKGPSRAPFSLPSRLLTCGRVLPEVAPQQFVHRRMLDAKLEWRNEEGFRADCEELLRRFGGVGVEQSLFAAVDAIAEPVVFGTEHAHPLVERCAIRERRDA